LREAGARRRTGGVSRLARRAPAWYATAKRRNPPERWAPVIVLPGKIVEGENVKGKRLAASALLGISLAFSVGAAPSAAPDSWSTNFSAFDDTASADIRTWVDGTTVSMDTTNVNSGGKSIRNSGRVDNKHVLQTTFSIRSLYHRTSVDLSAKALAFEVYVPKGSPISLLAIELVSGNNMIVARANIPAQKGRWYTYDVDINMVLALETWRYWDWMHSPSVATQNDAAALAESVQYLKVNAIPDWSTNRPTDAYFLVDRLGWEPCGPLPTQDSSQESLRSAAGTRSLLMGAYADPSAAADPRFMRIFFQEFGVGIAGIPWPASEPVDGNFEASAAADTFLENVYTLTGSPLARFAVGGMDIPGWLIAQSRDKARTDLEGQIRALVDHYRGKTAIWYVFNELLRYDIGWTSYRGLGLKDRTQSGPKTWVNNYSSFMSSPSDVEVIEAAFRAARETDPDPLLFLSEAGVEEQGQPRPEAFYRLVEKLVKDGTPIDGVAMQAHFMIGKDGKVRSSIGRPYDMAFTPTDGFKNVAKTVERYDALGLKVAFSEVDVCIYTADIDASAAGQKRLAERLQLQAAVYRSLLRVALTHSNVAAFFLWTWADPYDGWITANPDYRVYGSPGIFDSDYKPKPAYYALRDELAQE
jgi:endo-1,4-beta-xylanase